MENLANLRHNCFTLQELIVFQGFRSNGLNTLSCKNGLFVSTLLFCFTARYIVRLKQVYSY